ncbi:MAG: COX15/CtaA family protein [Acidimicrobiales bacterium]
MLSLQIGPRRFLLLCRVTLAVLLANIVTGAAVRLSDSGLGCPDWPTCSRQHLTPPLSLHPVVEFGNRVVVFLLVVACVATALASLLRRPARRDLRWLSGGLLVGVVGEAVLGAVVVYTKLNAYVVVTHFMVGIALLTVGVVLTLRANHAAGRGTLLVSRRALALTRLLIVMLVAVLVAGATTTGAGPHAGGKGAKRIPIGLEDMTRIHAETVIATVLVLLVLLWVLWRTNAPRANQDAGRILLVVAAVQGMIGYVQFFTHLPALLVGVHVFGATMVWSTAIWFHHGLSSHAPLEPEPLESPGPGGHRVRANAGGRSDDDLVRPSQGTVPEPEPA